MTRFALAVGVFLAFSICGRVAGAPKYGASDERLARARAALEVAGIPASARAQILARIDEATGRFLDLVAEVEKRRASDPWLLVLVDKTRKLPVDFVPADLKVLDGTGLSVSRSGHRLRKPALAALLAMTKAARAEGVDLLVSSCYRSYEYQGEVFARNVKELGELEARRVSAAPGASQHQLGAAIDFGSIDDSFAATKAGRWLSTDASRFGFSLSYPRGMEAVTGYVWESWHYRYVGEEAAALEFEFFGGMQQYVLLFLESYR